MKSFNKIGIITALFFGIILLFVSSKESSVFQKNPELAVIHDSDKVKSGNLNEWILEKNQNYMLIDIRTKKKFDEGSIPTAENIPLKELFKKDTVLNLPGDRPIIIYSNNDYNTNQAWNILMNANLKVFAIEGGYDYWKKYPVRPESSVSDEDLLIYKKELAVANFLKGIQPADLKLAGLKPVKKKRTKKRKKKKKNKLEGC